MRCSSFSSDLRAFALVASVASVALDACSSSTSDTPVTTPTADAGADAVAPALTDEQQKSLALQGMHDALLLNANALVQAATDLQALAPVTTGRGWDVTADAKTLTDMKATWVRARTAYEKIEGALAPLFPDIDYVIDARYDDFLADLATKGGDAYLFDDRGVTGMHAVERILFADVTPARVVTFEKALQGYVIAAVPSTETEAKDFKTKLLAKLVSDAIALRDAWTPAKINAAVAFQGLIALMNEQREKVEKASSNEEESRYAQRTMADLRDNLEGTRTAYSFFKPWIVAKVNTKDPSKDGAAVAAKLDAGLVALDAAYAKVTGDAIPAPPATWSAEAPSAADLATPFGTLYASVRSAVDPAADGSVVFEMNVAAELLGFPIFTAN